jgi:beta-barrel assembly-enhancing protease
MSSNRFLFAFLAIFFSEFTFAQNAPSQSRDAIPEQILGIPSKRANKEIAERRKGEYSILPTEESFILQTHFYSQMRVNSGTLLFNDTLSVYANRILDRLLKNDLASRAEVRAYVVCDSEVNSFTLDNGMIFVNIGLIAHLENEAQLAMILAHEIIHYKKRHAYQAYKEKIIRLYTVWPLEDYSTFPVSKAHENEFESDREGYKLFRNAGYAPYESLSVFDVMLYAELPFGQDVFSPAFFEHNDYKFPQKYTLDSVQGVSHEEDVDDSKSSHPNVKKRREKIANLVAEEDDITGERFLVSETWFFMALQLSRQQLCEIQLGNRDYEDAIYSSFVLLKQDSTTFYPKTVIARALYEIAVYYLREAPKNIPTAYVYKPVIYDYNYSSNSNENESHNDYRLRNADSIHGESQRLFALFNFMSDKERAVLALDWNWTVYKHTADSLYLNYSKTLMSVLYVNYKLKANDFYAQTMADFREFAKQDSLARVALKVPAKFIVDSTDLASSLILKMDSISVVNDTSINNNLVQVISEYDKLRREKTIYEQEKNVATKIGDLKEADTLEARPFIPSEADYYLFAFVETLKDEEFSKLFSNQKKVYRLFSEEAWERAKKIGNNPNTGLNIRRVVCVGPNFYQLQEKNRNYPYTINIAKSEKGLVEQKSAMLTSAAANKVEVKVLAPEFMDSTAVEDYNTYCMLQRWLNERLSHNDNALVMNVEFASVTDSLIDRLGTRYVMTTVVTNYPFSQRYRNVLTTVMYDLKTGQMVYFHSEGATKRVYGLYMKLYYHRVFAKIGKKSTVLYESY